MIKAFQYLFFVALVSGCIIACAKQGSPTGGPVDVEPPEFVNANPENFTTNFDKDEIRIYFDEYIKLEKPQRQIIVSPPMEPKTMITPLGTPRKYIKIEILDTLQENTTYTVNFGQSIVDNNEGNPMPFFKYVFSTGSYIDSLSVSGSVKSALQKIPDDFISVMLYEIDSTYSDSIVYNEVPTYISYTNDSLNVFQIENIKEGTYKLIALKDQNRNYKFDPEQDKIAFLEKPIQVPVDTVFRLKLFKEILDFEAARPKHATKQHLIFGYQGIADSAKIELLSEKPSDYEHRIIKDAEKDTLHYFFKPEMERDSLLFEISNENYRDTLTVFLRELEKDSLQFKASSTGTIGFDENFELSANIPIVEQDTSLISILDRDSLSVAFSSKIQPYENDLVLEFEKGEAQTYQITILPGAITDFFGKVNDTLSYRLRTKNISDYGILSMNLQNVKNFPIIVQLVDLEGEIVQELQSGSETVFNFTNIEPGEYFVRIIFDKNENGFWDTGNYLKNRQPETVTYFPDTLQVRANWDVSERFILKE
ncbi:MAG TPA: Ig-like domain-containing protein [Flavobacteriaceae bacterium]|nr:Ig-like domain-containing protein [Flavobacteriaceae bacterium]